MRRKVSVGVQLGIAVPASFERGIDTATTTSSFGVDNRSIGRVLTTKLGPILLAFSIAGGCEPAEQVGVPPFDSACIDPGLATEAPGHGGRSWLPRGAGQR
ncbi:MAG: hypothetical protein H0U13_08220 [Gemmatimonadaceae bacterium]|nr:hypothetical protein [Gemmatimonadaceae bacterium]